QVSGYWYEIARVPDVDVMDCLNISVPATADGELKLQLEYIGTYDNQRIAVRETVSFPWDESTQNSIFTLVYPTPIMNITVTYKLIVVAKEFTILCGYASVSPMPLFKLLTRQRQPNPSLITDLKTVLDTLGIAEYIIWTEQSPDKCNAAARSVAAGPVAILGLAIAWSLFK
ncbi:hypothetical protein KR222_010853, partial [Zaprionus bogoriensis]